MLIREISRQAHPGGVVEGTLDGQVAMNDIILRHITQLGTEGRQVTVIVLAVVEHAALVSGPQAAQCVHQHRFTRAGTTYQGYECSRRDGQGNIVEQYICVVAGFLEVESIDTDVFALIVLNQLRTLVNKLIRAYAYIIAHLQEMVRDDLGVDVEVIGAAQVIDAVGAVLAYHAGMITGNLRVRQDDGVVWHAPNGDLSIIQLDGLNGRQHLLVRSTAIVVSQCDQRVMFVPDAEEVSTAQRFAERLVSANFVALVKQSVLCLLPLGMRMDQDQ